MNIIRSIRNIFITCLALALSLALSGCSGNKAQELFETAQFEEMQKNQDHAVQLYEEILKKHPESEYAKKAEERLSQLKSDG